MTTDPKISSSAETSRTTKPSTDLSISLSPASSSKASSPSPTASTALPKKYEYYSHDGIQIYLGDCLDILPMLDTVDLVVTDPPYGMNRFRTDGADYLTIVGPALRLAFDCLPYDASLFSFASTGQVVAMANACHLPLYRLLWLYKPNDCTYPLDGWLLKSEAILWFRKGTGGLQERKPYRHDCYIHPNVGQEGVDGHPTVKPLAVIKDIVNRCRNGGTVLDPFLGSGTTLVAAKQLGRRAIGIEIEERYCEIAAQRLAQEELRL